jgi:hypothetical protein
MIYSIIALAVGLGFFISGSLILKRAEKKLQKNQEEYLNTLKEYTLVLRIYRDFLKMKKDNKEFKDWFLKMHKETFINSN